MRALLVAAFLLVSAPAIAQPSALGPKYEFRGAWVATVVNLDWPSTPGLPAQTQQNQLIAILDGLQAAGVNAVIFQVRPEADALYASDIEPWSYWLTGTQGSPPNPEYDPLAFAVEEAHKRGMELHAWLNPYRANRGSGYPTAPNHVTNQHPDWLLLFTSGGNIRIFDPGLQVSRDRVASVAADIARRYDVDGIHFDDYFYPYPPNQISTQDHDTFAADPRGFTDIGDWRRDNVNLMVAQVQDSLLAVDPSLKYGISPFGIWRNNVPSGISGLDAYNVIYADATAWLNAQTIDYIAPQLYWSSQRSIDTNGDGLPDTFNRQNFTVLAPWWESVRNTRHLYPGMGAYRQGTPGFEAGEIPDQIRFTRATDGVDGNVLFRVYDGILSGNLGLSDSLENDLYRRAALTPPMAWKSQDAPDTPGTLSHTWNGDELTLSWSAPTPGSGAEARRYAVYRIPSPTPPTYPDALNDPEHLIAVTGETSITDRPVIAPSPYTYVVTAVSANSIESTQSNEVVVDGRAVTTERAPEAIAELLPPRPNPSAGETQIAFSLATPSRVTVRVLDVLGREVVRLVDEEARRAGLQSVAWDGRSGSGARVASGTYLLVLETEGSRQTRPLVVVR